MHVLVLCSRLLLKCHLHLVCSRDGKALERFLQDYFDGNLKKYLKSEPIPENNDGPVKVRAAETCRSAEGCSYVAFATPAGTVHVELTSVLYSALQYRGDVSFPEPHPVSSALCHPRSLHWGESFPLGWSCLGKGKESKCSLLCIPAVLSAWDPVFGHKSDVH